MDSFPERPRAVTGLGALAGRYEAVLCDIWGVVHDGKRALGPAVAALRGFRASGPVILITNAPRPRADVALLLDTMGAPRDSYDAIVTSGDVTIALIAARIGEKIHHLGPARDHGLFDEAARLAGRAPQLAPIESADYVLCTGLVDDAVETPDDYAARLAAIRLRGLPMVCANPDILIHRGADVVYCAGALAREYDKLGGEVVSIGKPHRPIYDAALAAARALRPGLERRHVLAIGDGLATDVKGAEDFGLDTFFIAGGIHRGDVIDGGLPPSLFAALKAPPLYWADSLAP